MGCNQWKYRNYTFRLCVWFLKSYHIYLYSKISIKYRKIRKSECLRVRNLKKVEIVQWEMLLLILKKKFFCECPTKSHNKVSDCICITVYICSCYHPLSQFSFYMWLTILECCWHGWCSVYIVYGAKASG